MTKKKVHLFIEIYTKGIRGAIWVNKQLQQEHYLAFTALNEIACKESFNEFLNNYGSLSQFENVTCSVAQTNFTLVPASLFSVAEASKFLQFTTTDNLNSSETDYARLNYFNSVGVYTIPNWIKSVLIPKFPGVVISHERIMFLRKLEQLSGGIKQLTVVLHKDYALLANLEAGVLKWHISNPIENSDDVLFHLLNALEKMQIDETTICFYAHSTEAKEHLSRLNDRKKSIQNLQKHKWIEANDSHLQFQLLCV